MITFKCKMCGGDLTFEPGASVAECPYCGTNQTLPKLDDDKRANLYDRANHFRRQNEYDKAMAIYEQILAEDRTDAEAYWSLVLCRYGIEYVEDPASRKRVPTVNRVQYASILADEDYKSALANADAAQRGVYEAEANAIAEIQRGILDISRQEEPFDVFICYKETDANGRRTPDSVLATELYHELTKEGFKVFFARITLEDKIGTAYEPYIFAALNSARVMVALGTKPEHFNAVWVKNEWSRYLALIRNGADKTLVPAYRDMDPYDLPEEFAHLQALDMGKLGFMQDLIRGIKKILRRDEPKPQTVVQQTVAPANNAAPLVKRAFMSLEDGDFAKADDFCEQALNLDPENARAWLGKLMAQLKVRKEEDLKKQAQPFDGNGNYQKALRFGDEALKAQLKGDIEFINNRNEHERQAGILRKASEAIDKAQTVEECRKAREPLIAIRGFEGVNEKLVLCEEKIESINNSDYQKALKLQQDEKWQEATEAFTFLQGYKDSCQRADQCLKEKEAESRKQKEKEEKDRSLKEKRTREIERKKKVKRIAAICVIGVLAITAVVYTFLIKPEWIYQNGIAFLNKGRLFDAKLSFQMVGKEYRDSARYIDEIKEQEKGFKNRLYAEESRTIGTLQGGTLIATSENSSMYSSKKWKDIVEIASGDNHIVGLKSDGTVVAVGRNGARQCDISEWSDIIAIAAGGDNTFGLKSDGTVIATGSNYANVCDIDDWHNIVAIAAGDYHTVGVKGDGTVVTVGQNKFGECNVGGWRKIIEVEAGTWYTVGLTSDGSVIAAGNDKEVQNEVKKWRDIVDISTGDYTAGYYVIGLKSDGTVVKAGTGIYGTDGIEDWSNIVDISASGHHIVGLQNDGSVVATGDNYSGQCNVEDWKLFEKEIDIF